MKIELVLNYGVVICGFIAAIFWLWSAIVKVKPTESKSSDNGFVDASITVNGGELSETLKAQSKYSAIAAIFAAIAAILQASLIMISA